MKIEPSGPYILVIEYVTPVNNTGSPGIDVTILNVTDDNSPKGIIAIRFQAGDGPETSAIVNLNDCPYTAPCRQVVADDLSKIITVNVMEPNNVMYLEVNTFLTLSHKYTYINIYRRHKYKF